MATQQLVLLRHAKSDWRSGAVSDFDRPLNKRGRLAARAMGEWFNAQSIRPDTILCSSAERTTETWSLVSDVCQWRDVDTRFTRALYHASVSDLLQIIEPEYTNDQTLLVIGHNPGLEMLLLHYCPEVSVFPDGKLMPTATAAVIALVDGTASRLLHLHRPEKV